MGGLNERNPPLWVETSPEIRYRALSGKPSFDAIVIGGGIAGLDVDDEPRAAEAIGEDAIGDAVRDHVRRHVRLVGIDEAADDLIAANELGDGAKLVLVEEALDQEAIERLRYSSIPPIDEVVDGAAARQRDLPQVPEHVVQVGRGEGPCRLGSETPFGV